MSQLKTARKMFLIPTIVLVAIATIFIILYQSVRNRTISINEWSLSSDSIRGVDISAYQVNVDMARLKEQGIQFIYIKATEGRSHVDDYFASNWQKAKDANLRVGAYHFFNFESSGADQAENFIHVVGENLAGHLFPAVDVEIYGNERPVVPDRESLNRELKVMLDILEAQYGVKPIIYAQKEFYDQYLTDFADYPRWIRDVYLLAGIKNGNDWLIWQYNDRGQLDGYSGGEKYIDLDVINPSKSLDDITIK